MAAWGGGVTGFLGGDRERMRTDRRRGGKQLSII